jgi:hypothetical protein
MPRHGLDRLTGGAPGGGSGDRSASNPETNMTKSKTTEQDARATKASIVLDLLRRDQGATLAELIAATGWLPHTTRAALTGLRKKGHVLDKSTRDGVTCYRIEAA